MTRPAKWWALCRASWLFQSCRAWEVTMDWERLTQLGLSWGASKVSSMVRGVVRLCSM